MIACWIFKRAANRVLDAGTSLETPAQGHLGECGACRVWYAEQVSLVQSLNATQRFEQEPKPFLHARVMSRLRAKERPVPSRGFQAAWGLAAAVGCAALLLAFNVWRSRSSLPDPVARTSEHGNARVALVEPSAAAIPSVTSLMELSRTLDQPLEKEMKSVVHDAQRAMNLLAYNFLPSDMGRSPDNSP